MKAQTIVSELINWANRSMSYLSSGKDYSKGYRDGILCAQGIIEEIVEKHQNDADLVYVIQINHVDGIENLGIFSTKEKAERFTRHYKHFGEKVMITPVELDKAVAF